MLCHFLKFAVTDVDVVRSARALCAKVVPHRSVAFYPLFGNVVCVSSVRSASSLSSSVRNQKSSILSEGSRGRIAARRTSVFTSSFSLYGIWRSLCSSPNTLSKMEETPLCL